MPRVTLLNRVSFECGPGETILSEARRQGILLEHSCMTGRCGACKAGVLSGETKLIRQEESIYDGEICVNEILTCCRTAESDIELDISDLGELKLPEKKTLPCRIDKLAMLSHDVIEVTLRTPPGQKLSYLAGQYIDVIGKNGIRRSYSIAHAPKEDGNLCLHIRKVAGGVMSQYWFEDAKVNDLLRFEGPLGSFCLRNSKNPYLVLLATGTGIAPIKALLDQLSKGGCIYKNIYLYWGGRDPEDFYCKLEYPSLPFNFIPVLSRENSDWDGRFGYVQDVVKNESINFSEADVYACGSLKMINDTRKELAETGMNMSNFFSDAFVSSN